MDVYHQHSSVFLHQQLTLHSARPLLHSSSSTHSIHLGIAHIILSLAATNLPKQVRHLQTHWRSNIIATDGIFANTPFNIWSDQPFSITQSMSSATHPVCAITIWQHQTSQAGGKYSLLVNILCHMSVLLKGVKEANSTSHIGYKTQDVH